MKSQCNKSNLCLALDISHRNNVPSQENPFQFNFNCECYWGSYQGERYAYYTPIHPAACVHDQNLDHCFGLCCPAEKMNDVAACGWLRICYFGRALEERCVWVRANKVAAFWPPAPIHKSLLQRTGHSWTSLRHTLPVQITLHERTPWLRNVYPDFNVTRYLLLV